MEGSSPIGEPRRVASSGLTTMREGCTLIIACSDALSLQMISDLAWFKERPRSMAAASINLRSSITSAYGPPRVPSSK